MPETDRLATRSASEALQIRSKEIETPLSTGLSQLDRLLRDHAHGPPQIPDEQVDGGIPRGQVTEVYGAPGVGKTALALVKSSYISQLS